MNPGVCGPWEATAAIDDVAAVAEAADRPGLSPPDVLLMALLTGEVGRRGSRYWDPLATLAYLAARTTQIRLATNVLVLPYHHSLDVAKRYGSLDVVSKGRLVLGVGVGTLKEQFDLLTAPFDNRGPRSDDALRALRIAL